jgi:hypothetical protein
MRDRSEIIERTIKCAKLCKVNYPEIAREADISPQILYNYIYNRSVANENEIGKKIDDAVGEIFIRKQVSIVDSLLKIIKG